MNWPTVSTEPTNRNKIWTTPLVNQHHTWNNKPTIIEPKNDIPTIKITLSKRQCMFHSKLFKTCNAYWSLCTSIHPKQTTGTYPLFLYQRVMQLCIPSLEKPSQSIKSLSMMKLWTLYGKIYVKRIRKISTRLRRYKRNQHSAFHGTQTDQTHP